MFAVFSGLLVFAAGYIGHTLGAGIAVVSAIAVATTCIIHAINHK